ncbi:MAG: ABC transporter substrate-binding protein [Desulfatitalea sp.]|nr:ABC transporter substrate-binding protein [Desulfatitalea sp.]
MKLKSILLAVIVPMLALVLLADPGHAQRERGFDDKEIRIGQWGPQTGPAAPWGAVARGSKLVFDMVNERGGIHGRKIRYFIRDDQYNPSQTMAGVRELVDRRDIFAFVGGVGTAPGMAVKDYLKQNEIIWIGVCSGAEAFQGNPWQWNMWPSYFDDGSLLAKFAVENKGYKKIALFYQNDDWGMDAMKGINRRLKEHNMELVAAVPVEPIERDLSSQIARLQASGAEAVIGIVAPTQAAIALRTAVSVGYQPQWLHSYNLCDFALMNHITDGLWAREGVITSAFTDDPNVDTPLMNSYREAIKKYAPEERWGIFYMAGIVVAEPMVHALEQVGPNLSQEALKNALNNITDFKGIGPRITWSADNHRPPRELQIWQCGPNGETIVVQDWIENELPME